MLPASLDSTPPAKSLVMEGLSPAKQLRRSPLFSQPGKIGGEEPSTPSTSAGSEEPLLIPNLPSRSRSLVLPEVGQQQSPFASLAERSNSLMGDMGSMLLLPISSRADTSMLAFAVHDEEEDDEDWESAYSDDDDDRETRVTFSTGVPQVHEYTRFPWQSWEEEFRHLLKKNKQSTSAVTEESTAEGDEWATIDEYADFDCGVEGIDADPTDLCIPLIVNRRLVAGVYGAAARKGETQPHSPHPHDDTEVDALLGDLSRRLRDVQPPQGFWQ